MGFVGGVAATRAISYLVTLNIGQFRKSANEAEDSVNQLDGVIAKAATSTAGLIAQMLILGATVKAIASAGFRAFAPFNAEITMGAIASGRMAGGMNQLSEEAMMLSRNLEQLPQDMAALTRAISFFGGNARENAAVVAEFSTKLSELSDASPTQAGETLVRLLRAVGGDEAVTPERVAALSGAIFQVGTNVTSSVTGLLKFLEISQSLGPVSELNEIQIVALSGAIADLNERQREIATTALTRVFLTENFEELSAALGLSVEETKAFRKNDPVGFFLKVAHALRQAGSEDRFVTLMKDLNIGELRSGRGLSSIIANLERLEGDDGLMALVSDDTENLNAVNEAFEFRMSQADKRIQAMQASLKRLAITIGGTVAPVIAGLADAMTKLADAIAPIAPLLFLGGAAGAGVGIAKLGKALAGKFPIGKALASALGLEVLKGQVSKNVGRKVFEGGKSGKALGLFAKPDFDQGKVDALRKAQAKHPFTPLKLSSNIVAGATLTKLARLTTVIGWVTIALEMLAPVFDSMADGMDRAAKKGGLLTGFFRSLSISFKILSLIGNGITAIFTLFGDGLQFIGNMLAKVFDAVGMDKVAKKLRNIGDSAFEFVDKANEKLKDFNEQGGFVNKNTTGAVSIQGQADRSGDTTVNATFNGGTDSANLSVHEMFLGGVL